MKLLFHRYKHGGTAAVAGLLLGLMMHGAAAQTSQAAQAALDAAIQARIDAAEAEAEAAVARARAQVAQAQEQARQQGEEMKIIQNSGSGVNSISVVGNQAGKVVVECQGEPGAEVHVNSVVADGQSLKGKTVIVAGRNTRDVELRGNCKPAKGKPQGNGRTTNINSVVIR